MPIDHLVDPPLSGTSRYPIREDGVARADITNVQATIWIGHEGTCRIAVVECAVFIAGV